MGYSGHDYRDNSILVALGLIGCCILMALCYKGGMLLRRVRLPFRYERLVGRSVPFVTFLVGIVFITSLPAASSVALVLLPMVVSLGLGFGISGLLNPQGRPKHESKVTDLLFQILLSKESAEAMLGDLDERCNLIRQTDGPLQAEAWRRRQIAFSLWTLFTLWFRRFVSGNPARRT
jgi:hypothetical protein